MRRSRVELKCQPSFTLLNLSRKACYFTPARVTFLTVSFLSFKSIKMTITSSPVRRRWKVTPLVNGYPLPPRGKELISIVRFLFQPLSLSLSPPPSHSLSPPSPSLSLFLSLSFFLPSLILNELPIKIVRIDPVRSQHQRPPPNTPVRNTNDANSFCFAPWFCRVCCSFKWSAFSS